MSNNTFIYKDLAFNPELDAQGDVKTVTDMNAIKQSIKSILTTRPGERVMRPTFGSTIHNTLFELLDDHLEDKMKDIIVNSITMWDSRVTVEDIIILSNQDRNSINIKIVLDLIGLSINEDSVDVDIEIKR